MSSISEIETLRRGNIVVVRIRTDDGLEGIGQTAPYAAETTEQVLHSMVAPYFLGRNPFDCEALISGFVRLHYKFLGGFLNRALSGVDTALWDIMGKAAGRPVFELLGGRARTEVPVYLSSMVRSTTPGQESDRLGRQIDEDGYSAVKIRVGTPLGADVDEWSGRTEAIIPHMRNALPASVQISADANGGFTVGRAISVGRMLEDHGYFHFEEPCPYPEIEQTAQVARELDIPVSGGEQDSSLTQLARMIRTGSVDIVQPDIGYLGGVTLARKVAVLAEAAGIPCTLHCANHSLLQVFSLHVATAMPSCHQPQEWSAERPDWAQNIYDPVLEVRNGSLQARDDRPGWGIELSPDFLKASSKRISQGDRHSWALS